MRDLPAVSEYLPFIVIGVTSGSVYAIAGVGLVLTFKTSGIFNFAHGAQAALGAFVMYQLWQRNGLPWPLAGLVTMAVVGVGGGLLLERMAHTLSSASHAARVAATVGLLVMIQGGLTAIYGAATITMPIFLPTSTVRVSGVNVRYEQLIVTLTVLVLVAGLYVLFNRSRLGASMQAVVDDPALLGLQGINASTVRRGAWIIGSCFATLSGTLLAPTLGLDAALLTLLVFFAFGAAAIGTFSSLPRTYIGGLAIGIGSSLLTKVIDASGPFGPVPSTLPFLVLFVVLLVTPKRKLLERGAQALRSPLAPIQFSATATRVGVGLGAVVLLAVPHIVDASRVPLFISACAFTVLFASLGLLVRTSNQISLCHMTFAGIGAASFAQFRGAGLPWLAALALAGAVTVPVGALVAVPAIRLSGVYLAIATFGFGLLVQRLFYDADLMFGPQLQKLAPRPDLGFLDTASDIGYYYVVLAAAAACIGAIVLTRRARLGRMLRALADSPVALDAHGASTAVTKLLVFCMSAFLAGIAGALIAPITGTAAGLSFDFSLSFVLLAVLFLAGRQPVLSAALASALFIVVPGYISSDSVLELQPVIFGAGAVIAAMYGGRPIVGPILSQMRTSKKAADRARSSARHPSPAVIGADS